MDSNETSILFVEDNATIRDDISAFLNTMMFKNIYVAKNGQEGFLKFSKHKPDIILTDLTMPIMDGLDMSRAIRLLDEDIPILLITSHFEKEITESAVDIGIDAYLFKPLELKRLKKILTKYIERILLQRKFKNEHKLLEQYKNIMDASASITKTNIDGVITYVNDQYCKMSGYSKKELIGAKHNIVKHPDNSSDMYKKMWDTITDKKIWRSKLKNLKKDGSDYYESTVIAPIVDEEDKIQEYISLKQDITEIYTQKENL